MRLRWALAFAAVPCFGSAQEFTYKQPPAQIKSVMEEELPRRLIVSPNKRVGLLYRAAPYLQISQMAQPFLRMAGVRLNPVTRFPRAIFDHHGFETIDLRTGKVAPIPLPKGDVRDVVWSPDGAKCAFSFVTPQGGHVAVFMVATRKVQVLPGQVCGGLGSTVSWFPDSKGLLLTLVDRSAGSPPIRPEAPVGPEVQESLGTRQPVRTLPDALEDSFAEQRFSYYMRSQLAVFDLAKDALRKVGRPGTLTGQVSPDGKYVLIDEVRGPYPRSQYVSGFAHRISVTQLGTGAMSLVADEPSEVGVPINGVIKGPREIFWKATSPSTLVGVQALDGGDPKAKAKYRDQLMEFDVAAKGWRAIAKLKERVTGAYWTSDNAGAVVESYDYDLERDRRYFLEPSGTLTLLSDISERELYGDPGEPVFTKNASGHDVLLQNGDWIYLSGGGASPTGLHPFLDRLNLRTKKTERLWQSDKDHYETVAEVLDPQASVVLTSRESPTEYPNFFLVRPGKGAVQLTHERNPHPELLGVTKKLIKYKRADGVDLSFTLYLPPNYKPGVRLPAVAEAYPLEYTDSATAGQVAGTDKRFAYLNQDLLFVLAGYAVMSEVAMPIVGNPKTVNDGFVEQLCADADAAAKAASATGVIDSSRIGVMGHSYGAFMTANLMAHSDVFRAGCAESGAYNRSLTPFGFQSERRTFWEAPAMYEKVSPFSYADRFRGPILLVHGQMDNNPGTYTIQSERLYQALVGNGATARLVILPFEAHGYYAKESQEHVIWEELRWFDRYVKDAGPRSSR